MLATAIQLALIFVYAAVALWTAVNSVLEHPGDRIELRETLIIGCVSLFWIVFYCAAFLAIAFQPAPSPRLMPQRSRKL